MVPDKKRCAHCPTLYGEFYVTLISCISETGRQIILKISTHKKSSFFQVNLTFSPSRTSKIMAACTRRLRNNMCWCLKHFSAYINVTRIYTLTSHHDHEISAYNYSGCSVWPYGSLYKLITEWLRCVTGYRIPMQPSNINRCQTQPSPTACMLYVCRFVTYPTHAHIRMYILGCICKRFIDSRLNKQYVTISRKNDIWKNIYRVIQNKHQVFSCGYSKQNYAKQTDRRTGGYRARYLFWITLYLSITTLQIFRISHAAFADKNFGSRQHTTSCRSKIIFVTVWFAMIHGENFWGKLSIII